MIDTDSDKEGMTSSKRKRYTGNLTKGERRYKGSKGRDMHSS